MAFPTGNYTETATLAGFQTYTQSGIVVGINQTTTVDFTMSPNTVSGMITDGTNGLDGVLVTLGGVTTTTSGGGYFTLSGVPAGAGRVLTASYTGYVTYTSPSLNILEGSNPQLASIIRDIVMQPVTIIGTVKGDRRGSRRSYCQPPGISRDFNNHGIQWETLPFPW